MRVLEHVNASRNLGLEFVHFGWNADEYLRTGISMPEGAMDDIRVNYDAVYLGAFGDPRVPDMKHAFDILLGMRFQLDLYVNYRPVKLLDDRLSPLKGKGAKEIDFVIFRENTEGAYVGMGGNFKKELRTRSRSRKKSRHAAASNASSATHSSSRRRPDASRCACRTRTTLCASAAISGCARSRK
jgi:isocitrate/isopropylmalate dehydrogenase